LIEGGVLLGKGVIDGVAGVVRSPLEGARQDGAAGFVRGLGLGVVGLIVKPVTGVLDAASSVTAGIKNTTTFFDKQIGRARAPRICYRPHMLIRPYDDKELEALCFLRPNGRFILQKCAQEVYKDHVSVTYKVTSGRQHLLKVAYVTTNDKFLSITLHPAPKAPSLEWCYDWSDVDAVDLDPSQASIVIHCRNTQPSRRLVLCGRSRISATLSDLVAKARAEWRQQQLHH
jgi:hypothetical protein